MRILSFNIWGGKLWEGLSQFLVQHRESVDVFCFQELTSCSEHCEISEIGMAGNPRFSDLYQMVTAILPRFTGNYGRELRNMRAKECSVGIDYGSAIFVNDKAGEYRYKRTFAYGAEEDRSIELKAFEFSPRILQTVIFDRFNLAIHNIHGIWTPQGGADHRGDNPARLKQSEIINQVMNESARENILCGDMNLGPETQSLSMLQQGRIDLVRDAHQNSTRSPLYDGQNKLIDRVIITKGLKVKEFKILPEVVSDHLALMLDLDIE